jgi:hypothetical protein
MKTGIYLIIIFLSGCSQTPKDTQVSTNSNNLIKEIKLNPTIPDSIKDYRNYYYLSNIPTKDFAELYLKDSIITNDYKKLYDCLDSLSSNNINTRNYYFKVLIKTLDNPEVVFHQNMGIFLVKNIDKFKKEFLERLSAMNHEEIKFYAQGIESYLSEKPEYKETWLNEIRLLEKKSTSEQLKKLNLFLEEIEIAQNDTME